jgi:hypothetical protein
MAKLPKKMFLLVEVLSRKKTVAVLHVAWELQLKAVNLKAYFNG